MQNSKVILITGASSGIGAELALQYAKSNIILALGGRNQNNLEKTAAECRNRGAEVTTEIIDVTDKTAMEKWIQKLPKLDLLIANAGVAGEGDQEIFDTNIGGVINTVLPAIEKMKPQKSGQIAIMSSLAGIRGLPSAPAYSASKSCVLAYGQALRGSLYEYGIKVSVICPGWIKTPLTDKNHFSMPLIMNTEKATKIIIHGLAKNKSIIAFPLVMYVLLKIMNFIPTIISDPIFRSLPKK